jgi:hypothetical protein
MDKYEIYEEIENVDTLSSGSKSLMLGSPTLLKTGSKLACKATGSKVLCEGSKLLCNQ